MSELNVAQPASYFNLHAEGCGYLNRVRTVKPEKGPPYLACTIAAKHGDATSPTEGGPRRGVASWKSYGNCLWTRNAIM